MRFERSIWKRAPRRLAEDKEMSIVEEIRQDRENGAKRLESEYKAGLMALARRFCVDESDEPIL